MHLFFLTWLSLNQQVRWAWTMFLTWLYLNQQVRWARPMFLTWIYLNQQIRWARPCFSPEYIWTSRSGELDHVFHLSISEPADQTHVSHLTLSEPAGQVSWILAPVSPASQRYGGRTQWRQRSRHTAPAWPPRWQPPRGGWRWRCRGRCWAVDTPGCSPPLSAGCPPHGPSPGFLHFYPKHEKAVYIGCHHRRRI